MSSSLRSPVRSPPRSPRYNHQAASAAAISRSLSPPGSNNHNLSQTGRRSPGQYTSSQQHRPATAGDLSLNQLSAALAESSAAAAAAGVGGGHAQSNYFSSTFGFEPPPMSHSAIDPNLVATTDFTRVQLLLRIMELEKKFARTDERARMNEDAMRMKLNELGSASSLSAERSGTILQRVSEVELLSRESEISLQTLEQKCGLDNELVHNLKTSVQTWRDQTKQELREEFTKNINLRNAVHHQELVTLMDKQQEQTSKLIKTHELTSQGFHTKLSSMEAKWTARMENVESKLEGATQEIATLKTKNDSLKQKLHDVRQQHDQQLQIHSQQLHQLSQALQTSQQQIMSDLEVTLNPIQQQLVLMSQLQQQQSSAHTTELEQHYAQLQTHSTQLSNLSDHASKMEGGYQQLRSAQLQIQSSIMTVSDGLNDSLNKLKEVVPTRSDFERFESTCAANQGNHSANIDALIQTTLSRLEKKWEALKGDIEQEQQGVKQILSDSNHKIDQQGKIVSRSTHAIQLIEEQVAAVQAKVLVANESTPLQMMIQSTQSSRGFNSPLLHSPSARHDRLQNASVAAAAIAYGNTTNSNNTNGFASPPPMPYQSPFTTAALQLNLSDAAGLHPSPTKYTSGGPNGLMDRSNARSNSASPAPNQMRSQSPYSNRLQQVNPNSTYSRTTEEDFVASFLGQK